MPAATAEEVFGLGAPTWLSMDAAMAHYNACNLLNLSVDETLRIGGRVAFIDASGVQLVLRVGKAGGATPWTVIRNAPTYWSRMYDGSWLEFECQEVGPKDARIIIHRNSLARFAYWRTGLRGVITELTGALSTRAYVHEQIRDTTNDSVTYAVSWA
jgi:hypothetical protein